MKKDLKSLKRKQKNAKGLFIFFGLFFLVSCFLTVAASPNLDRKSIIILASIVFAIFVGFILCVIIYIMLHKKIRLLELEQANLVFKKIEEEDRRREEEVRLQQEEKKDICRSFFNYVKSAEDIYNGLFQNIRINKIIENFFKIHKDYIDFIFLDCIFPEEFVDINLKSTYEKIENKPIDMPNDVRSSVIYKYLEAHYSFITTGKRLAKCLTNTYKIELEKLAISQHFVETFDKAYSEVQTLLFSFVSTGLVKNNISSRTAILIYFNMWQVKLLKELFTEKFLKLYDEEEPKNLQELVRIILKRDVSFPIEKIILYGCAFFDPCSMHLDILNLQYNSVQNFIDKVKQENYIRELESYDDSEEKQWSLVDLKLMSGYEFEEFIAELFRRWGYQTSTTKKSGDQGVDVLAEKNGELIAIQTKCYTHPVGNKAVQEIVAGLKFYHAKIGLVVTNSCFTPSAKELAEANNIVLWDGATVLEKKNTKIENLLIE